MAEVDEGLHSILSLEDELTCSICLSPFDCPVTTPCGHNFCQDCLLTTWKETFSCPQCRTQFSVRPELKKNTVLSNVVDTFKARSIQGDMRPGEGETQKTPPPPILCDTCMAETASQTCLTCMASFCEQHLRPHRENPIFRVHQLSEPVGDLLERICQEHNKLMEIFCIDHSRIICSFCLQQVHKGCGFTSLDEQRDTMKSDFGKKLDLVDEKIKKNEATILQIKEIQSNLKDTATKKKKTLTNEYQLIRDMLAQEEQAAMHLVDRELQGAETKLGTLTTKFSANIHHLEKARGDINHLLKQSQTVAFLQTSFTLPQAASFEPYAPRINLDSNKGLAFAASLKEYIRERLKTPPQVTKPSKGGAFSGLRCVPLTFGNFGQPLTHPVFPGKVLADPIPLSMPKPVKKPTQARDKSRGRKNMHRSMENLLELSEVKVIQEKSDLTPSIVIGEKRSELLKYSAALTLDRKTAHRRITLSEKFTKASVSDEQANYDDCAARFSTCSQVLTLQGFSSGRHYWEVKMSSSNFIAIGFAYDSIDRKGSASRLGRNSQSWCVEWFNGKLSAWHGNNETQLTNLNTKRVGVLLDYEAGSATFFNVADRAYPIHTFVFSFSQPVYPAFWIFSSDSSISLCKLNA